MQLKTFSFLETKNEKKTIFQLYVNKSPVDENVGNEEHRKEKQSNRKQKRDTLRKIYRTNVNFRTWKANTYSKMEPVLWSTLALSHSVCVNFILFSIIWKIFYFIFFRFTIRGYSKCIRFWNGMTMKSFLTPECYICSHRYVVMFKVQEDQNIK